MFDSAISSPVRDRQLQRRFAIQEHACRLVIERGFNGFTMDDLAAAVGVSRRTLFNDIADKAGAVLGPPPDLSDFPAVIVFTDRGPTGRLYPDLIETIVAIIAAAEESDPHADERDRLLDEAMAVDPKVFHLVTERFHLMTETLADGICRREGWPPADLRARTLAASVLSLIRITMDEHRADPEPGAFGDRFLAVVAAESDARAWSDAPAHG